MVLVDLMPDLEVKIVESISNYRGLGTTLESALGALVVGQHFGWRVLKMLHNPSTYRKYEQILGVSFQEVCPERTKLTKKSMGVKAADKLESFWAVARGKKQIPNKGMLEAD